MIVVEIRFHSGYRGFGLTGGPSVKVKILHMYKFLWKSMTKSDLKRAKG
jgi:hypothetical protein